MKKPIGSENTAELAARLRASLAELATRSSATKLNARARKSLDSEMRELISDIGTLLSGLDPIRQPAAIFDPSAPKTIGRFIALALVSQRRLPISALEPFYGSGVYAIYYTGPFGLYAPISGTETPIYVGQAAPSLPNARNATEQGARLTSRLIEHRKNISKAASTLDIAHFECRALVVQSGWETAAEDYLIHLFHPIWNSETKILYGLGKHGDNAATRANKRSPWDTIHPARQWADATAEDAKTPLQIEKELKAHFADARIYESLDDLLRDFVEELRQN